MRLPRRMGALLVAAAVLTVAPAASAQAPSASASSASTFSVGELDRMLAPFAHDSVEERRAAAGAVAALGSDATTAIAQKLAELRKGGDGGLDSVVKGVKDRSGKEGRRPARGADRAEAGRADAARSHGHLPAARARAPGHPRGDAPARAARVRCGRCAAPGARAPDEAAGRSGRRVLDRGASRSFDRDPDVGLDVARGDEQARSRRRGADEGQPGAGRRAPRIRERQGPGGAAGGPLVRRIGARAGSRRRPRGDARVRAGRRLEAARVVRGADGRPGAGRDAGDGPGEEALRRLRPLPPPGRLRAARRRPRRAERTASSGTRSQTSTRCSPGSRSSTDARRWSPATSRGLSSRSRRTGRPRSRPFAGRSGWTRAAPHVERGTQRDRVPRGRGFARAGHRGHRAVRAGDQAEPGQRTGACLAPEAPGPDGGQQDARLARSLPPASCWCWRSREPPSWAAAASAQRPPRVPSAGLRRLSRLRRGRLLRRLGLRLRAALRLGSSAATPSARSSMSEMGALSPATRAELHDARVPARAARVALRQVEQHLLDEVDPRGRPARLDADAEARDVGRDGARSRQSPRPVPRRELALRRCRRPDRDGGPW